MDEQNRPIYSFDSFQLDPVRRRLSRAGQRVPINSKTFDLLLALIENRGRELDKERLLELVWPNQIVEEGNLTVKMSALRKILGERKDEARFIVTIPGRGYRFVADVTEIEADSLTIERHAVSHIVVEESKVETTTSRLTAIKRSTKIWMVAVTAVLLAVAVGVFAAFYFKGSRGTPFKQFAISRQTNSGKVLAASTSPDGQYFVFAQLETDGLSLWLKHVPTGGAQRILDAKPVEYWGLTFTPDGNHIYATTFERGHADPVLSKIPLFGGPVQVIPVVTNTAVTFAPGGDRIAYVVSSSSSGGSILWTAGADGSNKKFVALRKDPNFFAMQGKTLAWSPQDETLACVVLNNTAAGFEMTVVGYSADGTEQRLTDKRWNVVSSVGWTADGRGLVLTGNEAQGLPQQIWHVSVSTGAAHRITNDLNSYASLSLTRDAGAVLAVQTNSTSAIWTASAGPEGALSGFREVFSEVGEIQAIGWSRDGNLYYQSAASGSQELWLVKVADKQTRQLSIGSLMSDFAVSPDDRYIVAVSNRGGRPNLWRMNVDDGSNLTQLTRGDGEIRPRFASDGQSVFFQRGFGDVRSSVWKVALAGGELHRVTEPHNTYPDISPDGRQVVYSFMDTSSGDAAHWRLGVAATIDGKRMQSFPLPAGVTNRLTRWTPDGRALTYIITLGGVSNLWVQMLEGGQARQISQFDSHQIETFDWSRDGKSIAVVRRARTSDVVLIRTRPAD